MKNIISYAFCVFMSGILAASAQSNPRLALAGVEITPTLEKKTGSSDPADSAQPQPGANVLGIWTGTLPTRIAPKVTLTLTRWSDGTVHGDWHVDSAQGGRPANPAMQIRVTAVHGPALDGSGDRLRITFGNDNNPSLVTLNGEINPDATSMKAQWIGQARRGNAPPNVLNFTLVHSASAGSAASFASISASQLGDLAHSINVQMFDRFSGENMFGVLGDDDLKKAVTPDTQSHPAYNLNDSTVASQFKQAGINYLLVTSLEDYNDQTLQVRRSQDFHFQTQSFNRTRATLVQTQGGIDPEVWQRQIITLNVRCQLYDASTGELLKSANSSFPTQRDYTAVAQGDNELSTSDLMTVAARKVSDWAADLVDNVVFPIQVLAKNDDTVTISRGTEAGLKEGQTFDVYVIGDELKDPRTGKVLGHDQKMVGRVSITELQDKFAKARVLEDNGIINGATLTRNDSM